MRVTGFIGKPLIARETEILKIILSTAGTLRAAHKQGHWEDAYKPFMMQHKYLLLCCILAIESSFLDVNVHPAKWSFASATGR